MDKKKVVILVGGYYPTYSPPGICLEKIVSYLKKSFDITIIAWRRSMEIKEDCFDFDGVHVVQVSDWLNEQQVRALGCKTKERFWKFIRIVCSTLRGEGTYYWVRRTMLRELERQRMLGDFDTVLSVGFPITTHLACKDFVRRHRGIKWLTYSTDTYYESKTSSEFPFLAKFRSKYELSAYKAADYNFFSREIINACKDFLGPDVLAKSSILDYMLFEQSAPSGFDTSFLKKEEINLLYAGGFIEKARSPEYFLMLLEQLSENSKIKWHVFSSGCYGDVQIEFAKRFPNRLVTHKPVSVREIRDVMNACDILVNISNDMDQFFPSKVFDYLSTGKPILNFTYPNRTKNQLFEKHPYYVDVEMFGDVDKDAGRVAAFCEKNKGLCMSTDEVDSLYSEYTPENNLKELIRQLEK